ncbi:MAG: glycosyltransferase [Candidatus Omnitrophota bacterium]|jgi:GT2 family glycosyltransferase
MAENTNTLVSVVIVTCGVGNYLSDCLDSLEPQRQDFREAIIIDNSLNPDFFRRIKERYSWAQIYPSEVNLYYCASLNKGIELSGGEFILCLNDDVSLAKDFIHNALKGFFNDNIGMVSGKILRKDKKTLDSAGLFLTNYRTAKERGYALSDTGKFAEAGFIFGASGCAAFYRRKMLESIKEGKDYLDTDLRMFYEDLDVSWRSSRRGWKSYYIPEAIAYHARGGSFRPESGLNKPMAVRYLSDRLFSDLIKNRYIVMLKNERFSRFILNIVPIVLYDLCLWGYVFLFRPKVIKIFISDRKYFARALRKRNKLIRLVRA